MPTRSAIIGPSVTRLELRVDQAEPSQAATTDAQTLIPWPLEPTTMIDTYLASPWLSAIGNLLTDATSSGAWELRARETDLSGRPLASLTSEGDSEYASALAWLSREDVGGDGVSQLDLRGLLRACSSTFDQTGNVFLEVVRDRAGTSPMRLVNLLPQFVRYEAADTGLELLQIDPYRGEARYAAFGSRLARASGREYLHQRQPNTVSSFYGLPAWIAAREAVALDGAHRRYVAGFFRSDAKPPYIISVTADPAWTGSEPTADDIDQTFDAVRNYLQAGGEVAGRNLTLQYPGGILVRVEPLMATAQDPTHRDTARNARDEILAVRHISLINLGLPEGGYKATAEEQSDNFRREMLEPFVAPIVAMINRVLHAPPPSGLGVSRYDFALSFERSDAFMRRIEGLVKAIGGPLLTPNEGRAVLGYEAQPGFDALYTPVNVVPGLPEFGGPDGESE